MKSLTFTLFAFMCQTASSFTAPHSGIHQTSSLSSSSTRWLMHSGRSFQLQARLDDDEELVKVPRRRQRRLFENEEDEKAFYDRVEERIYTDDEDEDEKDYDEDDDEYGLFSNVLIDNPLLDSIDPDGAAERFPELARDPRFWVDIFLFIAFLNFLSAVGPQDYFPDIPWYADGVQIGTAGM